MYKIGDKILYPMNGAGVIEAIEDRVVLGAKKTYYILRLRLDGIKIMIPTDCCDDLGVRFIITREEGIKALEKFRKLPIESEDNWNKRHRENMLKIKSGDICLVLDVIKNLMFRDKQKGLSTSERKLLVTAKQIAVSELVLADTADQSDINSILSDTIDELF